MFPAPLISFFSGEGLFFQEFTKYMCDLGKLREFVMTLDGAMTLPEYSSDPVLLAAPYRLKNNQKLFYFNARRAMTLLWQWQQQKRSPRAPRWSEIYFKCLFILKRARKVTKNEASHSLVGKRYQTMSQTEGVLGLLDEGLGALESWLL